MDFKVVIPSVVGDADYRIEMTSSCGDSGSIPKVVDAGEILIENGISVQIMHNGIKVVEGGYHGLWMADVIKNLRGHHEPQEELLFYHILKFAGQNATMIELGCFWSYYSLWFLKGHPERKTLGIEPDPKNLELGLRNARLNDLEIEIRHGYVGSPEQQCETFPTENSGDIYVPAISPSALINGDFDGVLDILHCDTQGAEIFTLQDCEELFRNEKIRFAVISTHSFQITGDPLTHETCLQMVRDFGGRILAEHDVFESFSGDGLIVAYFGKENIDFPDLNLSRNRYSTSLFRNPVYDLHDAMLHRTKAEAEVALLKEKIDELQTKVDVVVNPPQRQSKTIVYKVTDRLLKFFGSK